MGYIYSVCIIIYEKWATLIFVTHALYVLCFKGEITCLWGPFKRALHMPIFSSLLGFAIRTFADFEMKKMFSVVVLVYLVDYCWQLVVLSLICSPLPL